MFLKKKHCLASITDEQLLELGVPEAQLGYIKSFTSKNDFYNAEGSIPHDAYEYLSWLVEGFSIKEVIELLEDEKENHHNRRRFTFRT